MSKRRQNKPVSIGYGNRVVSPQVIANLSPESVPLRRLKDDAMERNMLLHATQGRRTRSIITNSDQPGGPFGGARRAAYAALFWR